MSELQYATVKRIMKSAGAKRVSKDATYEMMNLLETYARKISSTAASISENAKRRTVTKEDVKLSAEEIHGVISL